MDNSIKAERERVKWLIKVYIDNGIEAHLQDSKDMLDKLAADEKK